MTILAQPDRTTAVIPGWVVDLPTFCRWAESDDFPESGWYSHLDGNLWADTNMERGDHNQLKTKIAAVLTGLVEKIDSGMFFGDRMLLVNADAVIGTEPDGMFVSHEALADHRAELEKGLDSLKVVGTPEMVLEVVSPTSARKDTVVLRKLYHKARIPEYWVVNPLSEVITLEILVRRPRGYSSAPATKGWVHSPVFGKKFRLTTTTNRSNLPVYHLEVQD